MILTFLVSSFLISLLISGKYQSLNKILAIIYSFAYRVICGSFEYGFDRENFRENILIIWSLGDDQIIDYITKNESDPIYISLVYMANHFTDDPNVVILTIISLSIIAKTLFIINDFPRFQLLILSSYGLFLSPTLEFAAIRAALGMGILILAIKYRKKVATLIGAVAAVGFHYSLIVPVIAILSQMSLGLLFGYSDEKINSSTDNAGSTKTLRITIKTQIILVIVVIAGVFALSAFINSWNRSAVYLGLPGTLYSFGPPLVSLILILFGFSGYKTEKYDSNMELFEQCRFIAIICFGFSLGATSIWVTIGYRIMEIGWFFFGMAICICLKMECNFNRVISSLIGLLLLLSYIQINLGTWSILR